MSKQKAYKGKTGSRDANSYIKNKIVNWLKFLISIAVIVAVIGGIVWYFSNHSVSNLLSAFKDEADTTIVETMEESEVEEPAQDNTTRKRSKKQNPRKGTAKQYDDGQQNEPPRERPAAQVNVTSMYFAEGDHQTITVGSKLQLHLKVEPQGHNEPLEWSVACPSVIGVNTNGLVTAISPGQSVVAVKAKRSGKEAIFFVDVKQ